MISAAGVKTFFKKNATPIVLAVVALTVVMLVWRFMNRENFAAPLPNIVSQIRTMYANEHTRFKASLMLVKPQTTDQQNYVNLAKKALSAPIKIAIYDSKDDRAQGPTVAPGVITYPWINSKGTAVVGKDDVEDNVAWAIAHYAGVVAGAKAGETPRRMGAYLYLTAQIPRAPAAKPTVATPSPAPTPAIATADAKKIAADKAAAAAAAAAKAAAAKALAAKVKVGETLTGVVSGKQAPVAGGKLFSYTITFNPKGKSPGQKFVFATPNPNMPATVKLTMDQDGDVYKVNDIVYGKYSPLG